MSIYPTNRLNVETRPTTKSTHSILFVAELKFKGMMMLICLAPGYSPKMESNALHPSREQTVSSTQRKKSIGLDRSRSFCR